MYLFLQQELWYKFIICETKYTEQQKISMTKYHQKKLNSPELAEKLTPTYAPSCKRLTPSDVIFDAYNRENHGGRKGSDSSLSPYRF